ncbi:MAG: C10 family peptidase [Candidatus Cloacimonetes bacterium]|nr:C10 family peptidase [Candidatus Cloacimonadota bacterium]
MRYKTFLLIILLYIGSMSARPMNSAVCSDIAANKLKQLGKAGNYTIINTDQIREKGSIICYIFELFPQGYVVTSADDDLPPVIAYSFTSSFYDEANGNILLDLVKADISRRLENIPGIPQEMINSRNIAWSDLQAGDLEQFRPEQWPPEGTTPTGGWLLETWNQSSPYNNYCPMDPVTGSRSIAGCPSIAMGEILNYHRTVNSVYFDDDDDYYHNYAGRQYWIDDDYEVNDFLSFPQMNELLDTLSYHYLYDIPVTNADKAALVFACGVAAHQVYSSGGSGTFGVDQAYDAYEKFNFEDMLLIDETTPDFYEHIAQNIMDALPVHFATVTPAWDSGHNFVVDGYNTDGYFHVNFGWGGTYNGWYLLPDEVPYGLTVVEGAIVDIIPEELPAGFIGGQITLNPAVADTNLICLTIQNLGGEYVLDLVPDISGSTSYILQVPIGNYSVTAVYPDYEFITFDNIIVEEFQITTVDFELYQLLAPTGLAGELSGNDVTLSWQHDSARNLQYFNIYRNINSTAFTLLDTTSQLSYIDTITQPINLTYGYQITAVYAQDNESHSSNTVFIEYAAPAIDNEIEALNLIGNYPNPFNPSTSIYFTILEDSEIELKVFNLKGQYIITLASGYFVKGNHSIIWNGGDARGKLMVSGVYLYQLTVNGKTLTRCMLLLK